MKIMSIYKFEMYCGIQCMKFFKIFQLVYASKLIVILWRFIGIIIYFIKMNIILHN